jgi:dipeptide/tripeptide permease
MNRCSSALSITVISLSLLLVGCGGGGLKSNVPRFPSQTRRIRSWHSSGPAADARAK